MQPVHLDPHRTYRHRCAPREGECSFQVVVGETDLRVTAIAPLPEGFVEALTRQVVWLRGQVQAWALLHPEFQHSLVPVPLPFVAHNADPKALPDYIPPIVRRMSRAAEIAGVGPFAAIAGTIAQMVAESMVASSPDLLVENGGDIYMYSRRDRVVGLLPDPKAGVTIGLAVKATDCPLALCSSSATIGHSLSFGQGELALVSSRDGAVADAFATAFCNQLQGPDAVRHVVELARKQARQGVTGVFVQCQGALGIWGNLELAVVDAP